MKARATKCYIPATDFGILPSSQDGTHQPERHSAAVADGVQGLGW
jgi:hypothetical protein